MSSMKKITNI